MKIDICRTCKHAFTTGKDRLYCKKLLADKDDCGEYEITDWDPTFSYKSDELFSEIEKFTRLQRECKERTLAEIITKYDFVVGSKECKCKLMEVLPEGANIICSPYIESPTTIYAIKKFDTMDLLFDRSERGDKE